MAKQKSLVLARSEEFRPPTFDRMDDAHQIKTLTENFPFRWKNGQRDSVESLCVVLAYARDKELYRKCGCSSWQEYCEKYFGDPAEGFDELIEGARILAKQGWTGPFSEVEAREARKKAKQDKAIAAASKPKMTRRETGKTGGRGHKKGLDKSENVNTFTGNSAANRLRNLQHSHPEIAARYPVEFKTVSAAERAAGIRSPLQPPDQVKAHDRIWAAATDAEKAIIRQKVCC